MGLEHPRENLETRRGDDLEKVERRAAEPIPPALANSPDYQVVREISRGGMGVVYLARNRRMDRLEGLKVVNAALLERAGALERFEREMRAAARLNHPNIVTAYSSPPLEGLLAFAMEFVDGIDLYQLVRTRGPLPVSNACYYIHQAAKGLQHAHERGMVHRDIKPNNLMLTLDGKKQVVKILDFGLAKATSENPIDGGLTGEGQVLGTPLYMAPEQISHASKADIRADIYSLGCTLYYLLTGDPPFKDKESVYEILAAHHLETPRPVNAKRSDIPADLADIVAKMMGKEAARRQTDPAEVMRDLSPYFKAGIKAIPAGSARFSTPAAGPPPPETASSKAADATRMPSPARVAGPSPAPGSPGPADLAGQGLVSSDLQRALESPGDTGYEPATARIGKSGGWLSATKANPRIWAGLTAGVALLVFLGLWAGGVFDARRKPVDANKNVVAAGDSDRTPAEDNSTGGEVATAEPNREMPDLDDASPKSPARNTAAVDAAPSAPPSEDKPAGTEKKPAAWPADAVAFGSKRFKLYTEHLNWHGAHKKCIDLGGRLAEVRSREENDFLVKLASGTKIDGLWLGATDEVEEGHWVWSDDSPLTYTSWDKGQPNNYGPSGEHYLMLFVSRNPGVWWDQPNTIGFGIPAGWKAGFVCEWDAETGDLPRAAPLSTTGASPFFNGRDLTGWNGLPRYWKVRDGAIVGAPSGGVKAYTFLYSDRTYKDFELRFQVRRQNGVGNSGVQFRSHLKDRAHYKVVGPQMEIDSADAQLLPGSAFDEPDMKPRFPADREIVARVWKDGDFTEMHLRCVGRHVTVRLNGVVALDIDYPPLPKEGIIAWQLHGVRPPDEIVFKDIEFADLSRGDAPLPVTAGPTTEEVAPQTELLKSARKKYAVEVKNAEKALAAQFDREIDGLVKARLKPDERVHLSEALKAEKAAFEASKLIPWSRPMRPAVLTYLRDLMTADAVIQKAYDRHISAAIKAKDDAALEGLRTEMRTTAPRRLMGAWNCTGGNFNATWTWMLYSDGTLRRRNASPPPGDEWLWSLDGSLLYVKTYDAKDPKVRYNNRCTIAVDGGSFTGENNRDQRFAGTIDRAAK